MQNQVAVGVDQFDVLDSTQVRIDLVGRNRDACDADGAIAAEEGPAIVQAIPAAQVDFSQHGDVVLGVVHEKWSTQIRSIVDDSVTRRSADFGEVLNMVPEQSDFAPEVEIEPVAQAVLTFAADLKPDEAVIEVDPIVDFLNCSCVHAIHSVRSEQQVISEFEVANTCQQVVAKAPARSRAVPAAEHLQQIHFDVVELVFAPEGVNLGIVGQQVSRCNRAR